MNELQKIPNVDKLLANPAIIEGTPYRQEAVDAIRDVLTELREEIKTGKLKKVPEHDEIAQSVVKLINKRAKRGMRRVINGTGVILHSNLGRACLSKAAAEAALDEHDDDDD